VKRGLPGSTVETTVGAPGLRDATRAIVVIGNVGVGRKKEEYLRVPPGMRGTNNKKRLSRTMPACAGRHAHSDAIKSRRTIIRHFEREIVVFSTIPVTTVLRCVDWNGFGVSPDRPRPYGFHRRPEPLDRHYRPCAALCRET